MCSGNKHRYVRKQTWKRWKIEFDLKRIEKQACLLDMRRYEINPSPFLTALVLLVALSYFRERRIV